MNTKRRIAFLIMNIGNKGGTERVTSMVANSLTDKYDVYIYSCQNGTQSYFYTNSCVKVISLRGERYKNGIARKVAVLNAFQNEIKQNKIDIAIAVDVALYLYLLPLKLTHRCKCIAWEHFMFYLSPNKLVKLGRLLAAKTADCVVVLSKSDLDNYKENVKGIKRIVCINNPLSIDTEKTSDLKSHKVVTIGRLTPQKNQESLIRIWSKIEHKYPDWKLEIWGDGPSKEKLLKQIKILNLHNVTLNGYAEDIGSVLLNSSIFALTSVYEGFGLVLIEAQARGLPCISFDCKEGPREIIRDGINGFLVEPGDENLFAEKLSELIKNSKLREQFSSKAKIDLDKYNIDIVKAQWINLLDSI